MALEVGLPYREALLTGREGGGNGLRFAVHSRVCPVFLHGVHPAMRSEEGLSMTLVSSGSRFRPRLERVCHW